MRERNVQDVIVFEGPAGSGKSYLIRELEGTGYYEPLTYYMPDPPKRVRMYENELGPYFRDLHSITSVLLSTGSRAGKPLLVDRLFLGSLVYRQLKDHIGFEADFTIPVETFTVKEIYRYLWEHYNLAGALISSYKARMQGTPLPDFVFHYYIILPTMTNLIDARSLAKNRYYPFNPRHELSLYKYVANLMPTVQGTGHPVKFIFNPIWGYKFQSIGAVLRQIHYTFGNG